MGGAFEVVAAARSRGAVVQFALDSLTALAISGAGLLLAAPALRAQGFSTIWFGSLLLAVLYFIPYRRWPVYLVIAGLATYAGSLIGGFAPGYSALRAVADIAITAGAAWILRRRMTEPMRTTSDAWTLIGVAVGVGVARTLVGGIMLGLSPRTDISYAFLTVNLGLNAIIGILVIVPLVILAVDRTRWPIIDRQRAVGAGVALLLLVAVLGVFFLRPHSTLLLGVTFLVIPVIVLLAARYSQLALAVGMAILAYGIALATTFRLGPLAATDESTAALQVAALNVQMYFVALPVAAWLLSATRAESRAAEAELEMQVLEQRALTEELAATEDKFRLAVMRAAVPMSFGSIGSAITEFNDAMCRFYQLPREELMNRRWEDFTHPDDAAEDLTLSEALARGELDHYRILKRYILDDGTVKWGKLAVAATSASEGGSRWAIAQIVDVTAEMQAQEELRRSQEMLRTAVLKATIPMSFGPLSGGFTEINDARCAFHERTREQLMAMDWRDLTLPEDASEAEPLSRALVRGEMDQFRITQRFVMPDGRIKWGDLTASRVLADNNETDYSIVQIVDITAEVLTRQELERSQELFSTAVYKAAIPMTFGLAGDRHADVNDAFCEFLGYTREELKNMRWQDFTHPDDVAENQRLADALASGEADQYRMRMRYLRADGDVRIADLTVNAIALPGREGIFTIAQCVDRTDEELAKEQLRRQVDFDSVTDLHSRAWLRKALQEELTGSSARARTVALMMIDLSEFLEVNRIMGYEAGNEALRSLAQRVTNAVSDHCVVARFDGNSFLVMVPDAPTDEVLAAGATRILDAVAQELIVRGNRIARTGSIGIARSNDYSTASSLIRDADQALAVAKGKGRSRFHVLGGSESERHVDRLQLEHDLREALDDRQFFVHYQPQVSFATGEISGYEALVRWQHPSRGLLSPAAFIDTMEQSTLVIPLGSHVLETVCATLAAQPDLPGPISINVSAVEFAHPGWLERFQRTVREFGVDPGRLAIELTESTVLQLTDDAKQALAGIRAMGMGVHVDDFGTGFASVGLLQLLPVTALKLDRSFVTPLDDPDAPGLNLVRGIAGLAAGLGVEAIAEGIETPRQATLLAEAGWTVGQGYLFGRPSADLARHPLPVLELERA